MRLIFRPHLLALNHPNVRLMCIRHSVATDQANTLSLPLVPAIATAALILASGLLAREAGNHLALLDGLFFVSLDLLRLDRHIRNHLIDQKEKAVHFLNCLQAVARMVAPTLAGYSVWLDQVVAEQEDSHFSSWRSYPMHFVMRSLVVTEER